MDRYTIIWKAIQRHGYKYDYREVANVENYNSEEEKEQNIICDKHGRFSIRMSVHIDNNFGCFNCLGITDKFKIKTQKNNMYKLHNRYKENIDLSNTIINSSDESTKFKCNKCGNIFQTSVKSLLNKNRKYLCFECYNIERKGKNKVPIEEIINRLNKRLAEEENYDAFDLSCYTNTHGDIKIHCKKHGWFTTNFKNFIQGHGCYDCGIEKNVKYRSMKFDEFKEKADKIYGNDFIYFEDTFIKSHAAVKMQCTKCGYIFERDAHHHLMGYCRCQNCNKRSEMERIVQKLLEENNIKFEYNYRNSNWLKFIKSLTLDFYIPEYNIAIEVQGEQHFKPIEYFGGEERFLENLERDKAKLKCCQDNNIKLLYYADYQNAPNEFLNEKVFNNKDELLIELKKLIGS